MVLKIGQFLWTSYVYRPLFGTFNSCNVSEFNNLRQLLVASSYSIFKRKKICDFTIFLTATIFPNKGS